MTLDAKVRSGSDYGLSVNARNVSAGIPITATSLTLWGVPADPSHDPLRGLCLEGYLGNDGSTCTLSNPAREAFLRMPTSCTGPLAWGIDVDTYQHPDTLVSDSTTTPGMGGCEVVPFGPSFTLAPTTSAPHAPTGLDTTLTLPQDNGPDGVAQGHLKKATVTLPAGVRVSPSSAYWLAACSSSQIALSSDVDPACPTRPRSVT